jgi:hypothetical protein
MRAEAGGSHTLMDLVVEAAAVTAVVVIVVVTAVPVGLHRHWSSRRRPGSSIEPATPREIADQAA